MMEFQHLLNNVDLAAAFLCGLIARKVTFLMIIFPESQVAQYAYF